MSRTKVFIIVFIVISALFLLIQWLAPQSVSWKVSLNERDTRPYGTYVLYNSIEDLFPNNSLKTNTKNYYQLLDDSLGAKKNLIIIREDFYSDSTTIYALLRYIEQGNTVLISAMNFSKFLKDTLQITISKRSYENIKRPIMLYLEDFPKVTSYYNYYIKNAITQLDSSYFDYEILGTNEKQNEYNNNESNFISYNIGSGKLLIHCDPLAFTNYGILKNRSKKYVEHVLEYLPGNDILWDKYLDQKEERKNGFLGYILTILHLKIAYYLSAFLLILYIIINYKRKQRYIPIIKPPINSSMELIESISELYLYKKSNKAIADKMIRQHLDYILQKYYIKSTNFDDNFINKLSIKASKDKKDVAYMTKLIIRVKGTKSISSELLLELNQVIANCKRNNRQTP